jgi:hypothetical protein
MNADVFAEWLRRQGHRVYRTESSYWYDAGPRVLQAFPFGWQIQPSKEELHRLLMEHGIIALRYSTPLSTSEGIISYHVVLHNPYYLEMLHHQARNGVRRGLKNCTVERISFKRLAEDGWVLQEDTLERQGRQGSMNQAEWRRICYAAEGLPCFEAWGAMIGDKLTASLLTARVEDTWYVPYAQSHHSHLNQHVNNALFYTTSCEMLAQEGVSGIFFSLHSLDAPESVNEFKFRMSFIPKPVRQRIVFHPLFAPFANRVSYSLIKRLFQSNPENHILSKMEGMLHFYVQGKRPLNKQPWPECLINAQSDQLDKAKAFSISTEDSTSGDQATISVKSGEMLEKRND